MAAAWLETKTGESARGSVGRAYVVKSEDEEEEDEDEEEDEEDKEVEGGDQPWAKMWYINVTR